MGPEGVGNASISQIAQDASEGLLVTLPKSFDQDPANKALVAAFAAKKEDPSGPFVFPAYAAVEVITDAITTAKSEDTAKVAACHPRRYFQDPDWRPELRRQGRPERLQVRGLHLAQRHTKTEASTK